MKMLINGEFCYSSTGETVRVYNPFSNEVIDTVPMASPEDVKLALQASLEGKRQMKKLSSYKRYEILKGIADSIRRNAAEIEDLLLQENGKPIRQIKEEVECAAYIFESFAEEAKRIMGTVIPIDAQPGHERHFAYTIRQPKGTIAAIVPFNYPVELYAHKVAPALAAGNAVIVKPPTECPLAILKISELIMQTDIPRQGYQVVTGSVPVVAEELIRSPFVDMIAFTGSTRTGQHIAAAAAETLKTTSMELGGNDVTIVFPDADLEKAVSAVVAGRLARGNGQICCAVKRVLVHRSISEEFCSMLKEKASALKVGDPASIETDVGPLISERAAMKVEEQVAKSLAEGAQLVLGGVRERAFYYPTILTNVRPDNVVFREEVFGPVVPITTFDDDEEAVALANDSPYGLQAAVFTNDVARAIYVAAELEVGGVIVNYGSALRAANVPFGGVKMSGIGREGIHHTINEMTEIKSVIVHNAFPQNYRL